MVLKAKLRFSTVLHCWACMVSPQEIDAFDRCELTCEIAGLTISALSLLADTAQVCVEDQKRLPAEIIHAPVAGVEQMQKEFKSSDEIGTLGLSLFVLGFALGPLCAIMIQ